jgi:hypothetical protein
LIVHIVGEIGGGSVGKRALGFCTVICDLSQIGGLPYGGRYLVKIENKLLQNGVTELWRN